MQFMMDSMGNSSADDIIAAVNNLQGDAVFYFLCEEVHHFSQVQFLHRCVVQT